MERNTASILVIDDQVENLRALSAILKRRGHRVRQATSGAAALRTATTQPPDLILLDILMPQMDGYAICAALKRSPQTRAIPIIFLSALEDVSDKVRAFDIGGVDYITKPFQVREVLARIDNQLTTRQQQQQISSLLQQVQQLNSSLEQRVQAQTLELQQALNYERALKSITDRVRDSLDKTHILQNAIEELTRVLEAQCCDTVLYRPDQTPEIFCAQSASGDRADSSQQDASQQDAQQYDALPALLNLPGIHDRLAQGITVVFCRLPDPTATPRSAILGCPIQIDRTWSGTLWLFKPLPSQFSDQEVRLVQQVATHCAIALRQAQLYQESQAQIIGLQRLNQLKDEFLSTISHELRTPVANMHLVLQLLLGSAQGELLTAQLTDTLSEQNRMRQYFRILQEECERELCLIQDLLDFQQLEAETHPLEQVPLDLNVTLLHLLEPYELRAQNQQQQLTVRLVPHPPPLTTDFSCLSRIVTELLDNACKYTPAGAAIAVSTEVTATHLRICVSNSGVEISPAALSCIFDRFYRVPNNDPWRQAGTGLGLALAQKLAQHIGGTIEARSSDRWTHFALQLSFLV